MIEFVALGDVFKNHANARMFDNPFREVVTRCCGKYLTTICGVLSHNKCSHERWSICWAVSASIVRRRWTDSRPLPTNMEVEFTEWESTLLFSVPHLSHTPFRHHKTKRAAEPRVVSVDVAPQEIGGCPTPTTAKHDSDVLSLPDRMESETCGSGREGVDLPSIFSTSPKK